jgi:trk system potassium uptake protein
VNKIIIVGGGKLVYFLTRLFLSKGSAVTIINSDREECTQLARHLKATVVFGDGSDPRVQNEAEIAEADAVLAVTPRDQDNLVICQIAALKFRVPRVLALVNDPDNEEIFRELGVSAFSTTRIIADLIEQKAGFEEICNLLPLGEGKVTLSEVILNGKSPASGKALRDISLPENSLVAFILRDGSPIVPGGNTVLQPGDRLILVALPENHGTVLRLFTEGA